MDRRTLITTGVPLLIFAAFGAICFLLVTEPPAVQRFSVGVAVSASLLHTYALIMYVRGFRYFKQELRVAYTLLSIGIAFLGIAIAQLTFINLFDLQFWGDSGAMLIPYIIAVITILLGLRRFARSLDLHTKWLSLPVVGAASLIFAAIAILIPHAPNPADETTHDGAVALTAIITVFFVASARGTVRIRDRTGISYASSLDWLVVALLSAALGAFIYLLELLLSGAQGWYYEWSITILYFNLTGWLFLRAGYAFSIIGLPTAPAQKRQDVSSVDIILHLENLVSNPAAISPIVDELRGLTARIGSNPVSDADQRLLTVYRKLEDFLVTNEPLRKLSRAEIRQSVEQTFGINETSQHTFWAQVKKT